MDIIHYIIIRYAITRAIYDLIYDLTQNITFLNLITFDTSKISFPSFVPTISQISQNFKDSITLNPFLILAR